MGRGAAARFRHRSQNLFRCYSSAALKTAELLAQQVLGHDSRLPPTCLPGDAGAPDRRRRDYLQSVRRGSVARSLFLPSLWTTTTASTLGARQIPPPYESPALPSAALRATFSGNRCLTIQTTNRLPITDTIGAVLWVITAESRQRESEDGYCSLSCVDRILSNVGGFTRRSAEELQRDEHF
jgi:hypothetical protein